MDPFELLKKDHKKVSELFKQAESATGQAKLKKFKQIKSELDLHAHIEETILYPALQNARESRDLTLEAYEEHKVIKELLAELNGAKSVTDEWKAKLRVLQENVDHHVKEEENELFDKANDVLTGDEAETLGDKMAAEKERRGGKVEEEKPGIIGSIVNALGMGGSTSNVSGGGARRTSSSRVSTKSSKKSAKAGANARRATKAAKSSKSRGTKKPAPAKGAAKRASRSSSKKTGGKTKKR
jgi:hypothetical protein